MSTINQQYLRECFDYVDGKLIWKERPRHHFNSNRGFNSFNTNYAYAEAGCVFKRAGRPERHTVGVNGKRYLRHRLIWIYHHGEIPDDLIIDHIDGDTLNDRIENLRLVTLEINANNSKQRIDNRSGVTGVSFNTRMKKWRAKASHKGKDVILYLGDDFDKACAARRDWENRHPHMTQRHGKRS